MASSTDSRVILDSTGAERLLGQGDMLFQSPDAAAPLRLQGCFVSPGELDKLIGYWQRARRFNLVPAQESVMPKAEAEQAAKTRPTPKPSTPPSSETLPPPSRPTRQTKKKITKKPEEEPAVTPQPPSPPPPTSETLRDEAPARSENIQQKTENKQQATPESKPAVTAPQRPLWEELQDIEEQAKYEDELMPDVIAMVRKMQKASTSLLQRRFRIGYTRAARMIDAMEEDGIIGPPTGTSKAREVLLPPEGEDNESNHDKNEKA